MANRHRRDSLSPTARIPQLIVSVGCSLVAFSGVWLWWFGQDISDRVGITNDLDDPLAPQVWMRQLHRGAAYAVAMIIFLMVVRALVQRGGGWRVLFLVLFLLLLGVGFGTGFVAEWNEARVWSETTGGKVRAGLDLTDLPPLPDSLRQVRVHLSIVPAALLVVALGSFYQYRRN